METATVDKRNLNLLQLLRRRQEPADNLDQVIERLRRRWRLRLLLDGLFVALLGGGALFLASAWILSEAHYAPAAVWLLRALGWA